MSQPYLLLVEICFFSVVYGAMVWQPGWLLYYTPMDISNECAFSGQLRYDLSFGMGLSDTTTLVLRTINEIDYACNIEIVTDVERDIVLIVVIKFPTVISHNCRANKDAFKILMNEECHRLCDFPGAKNTLSSYFIVTFKGRMEFRFLSNSSINSEIDANLYQVTATAARPQPPSKCNIRNETLCVIKEQNYCFTNGVVCDGIKNCGVSDWLDNGYRYCMTKLGLSFNHDLCQRFDERKSECNLPVDYLSYTPVIAVVGAILCALLAGGHILMRCLPISANTFFIFNTNEDNRLCIDPSFKSLIHVPFEEDALGGTKRRSLIPVSSSSSSEQLEVIDHNVLPPEQVERDVPSSSLSEDTQDKKLKSAMKSVTAKLQQKIRSVTRQGKLVRDSTDC